MSITPYVVGQWVRGEKFYGRGQLIEEIIRGNRNWIWLLGTRRIGKTSVLKQVEHLTSREPELGYFPIFWDFQGADDPKELHAGFRESLYDVEEQLDELGIPLADVESDDLFVSLGRLRRKLRSKSRRVLLLCDEVEELIKLHQKDSSLLRKLRRAMQSQEDIRSVLASTIRLWALADQGGDTSPFLHGFSPPLYIHNLADDEALSLIRQANLASDSRPRIDDDAAEKIRSRCDNHPYLIQLVCKRFLELGNLTDAAEQISSDPMVSYFFSVDFEMLTPIEQQILRVIAENDSSSSNSIQEELNVDSEQFAGNLHRLEHLGFVRRNRDREFVLANYFFRKWFRSHPAAGRADGPDPVTRRATTGASLEPTRSCEIELGPFDGRYNLVEHIGKGATGVVYRARDTLLAVDIAVKVLRDEYASNEDALERIRREIILSRDIAHPNVVRVYHLGQFRDVKYITMQWIDGPTLADLIVTEGKLGLRRVAEIGSKLAGALAAAHACRVLHRDVKPHNVLMDRSREPYLSDFGLARLAGGPGTTSAGVFLGTPNYASPEQVESRGVDERSDIYSLGVVLFEAATGRRPFSAESTREILRLHVTARPPDPRDIEPTIPQWFASVILRCLEKRPERRFASAEELRSVLNEADTLPA